MSKFIVFLVLFVFRSPLCERCQVGTTLFSFLIDRTACEGHREKWKCRGCPICAEQSPAPRLYLFDMQTSVLPLTYTFRILYLFFWDRIRGLTKWSGLALATLELGILLFQSSDICNFRPGPPAALSVFLMSLPPSSWALSFSKVSASVTAMVFPAVFVLSVLVTALTSSLFLLSFLVCLVTSFLHVSFWCPPLTVFGLFYFVHFKL